MEGWEHQNWGAVPHRFLFWATYSVPRHPSAVCILIHPVGTGSLELLCTANTKFSYKLVSLQSITVALTAAHMLTYSYTFLRAAVD